ncbi:ParB/RepB/Spo0J family partition protein [Campylobacter helveticus]|uniref:ParB/RepB/Spo0J family partition protein n=1 Tax=Campylobacter helveticus TaxID=28898 RepID=A0AAX2ULE4_9BACT|nr:ParB/RepB/Spo0J family partition protein [Campylobacter helveticus]ARE79736.1 chromosome partitioning protein [Campylobacter helveticus]MCR2054506.1 ParB/RepB/Spo0J family partition protein [Campylobacter helveticus]MCR2057044.1 ParB/RepB/Spo0J family partition protein [Campylobacter helveticus]MCR2059632.1 ParB/RepB/Spo0J family partition protein [Campylobacter helveticus]MCR2061796.1 ParB/RepB/Spo0J family partition protein [Campylobacter helveticus]
MGLNKDKGLSRLIGDMDEVYSRELGLDKNQVNEIPLTKIDLNPYQPRKHFDEEALKELANSIEEYGLIQPIIVLKKGERYVLVAGERRLRASKILGLKTILAFVADAEEKRLRELALIENIQRENLNPIELAHSYKSLIDEHQITQENLASIIHKSRTQITNTLRLLNLDETTQKLIAEGKISQGHAKILVGLKKEDEKTMVDSIIGQKLSVRDTEKIVQNLKNKKAKNENFSFEFDREVQEIKRILNGYGLKCESKREKLTIYLTNKDKIKKLFEILA